MAQRIDPVEGRERFAWAAGFIDGDGSIGLRTNSRKQRRPVIEASQAEDPAPLERLKELFGGCIHAKTKLTGAGKTVYVWRVTDRPALAAIQAMAPFLVVKKARAEDVVAFCSDDLWSCEHGKTYQTCGDCHAAARARCVTVTVPII